MSAAFSIMIAHSSYLPRKTDLSNSGFIVGLSNAGFEFLAAIGVFRGAGGDEHHHAGKRYAHRGSGQQQGSEDDDQDAQG